MKHPIAVCLCVVMLLSAAGVAAADDTAAATAAAPAAASKRFNYAEALQKSLYFYEAQQSGGLSPNNRVAWRGPSCMDDGKDIGADLSGGWYDAGDHWTANLTMSFAATCLAWSAVDAPDGYLKSDQMDDLLEQLVHVNGYFLKCVLTPGEKDPAANLRVVIGKGGREGVDEPNVHAMWAAAEVAHLMTNRPTFLADRDHPAADICGAMSAAMASSSMVIRAHGHLLKGRKGYDGFDAVAFADRLLAEARNLLLFAHANPGPRITKEMDDKQKAEVNRQRAMALRGDGKVVEIGYRATASDKIFTAATWVQRAALQKDPAAAATDDRWIRMAEDVYEGDYKLEHHDDWYRDFGAGGFGKLGAYNMVILRPADERFHHELQYYCSSFVTYKQTPGGLRLREWEGHQYGSLRHANNAAVVALYYSRHVEKAPKLKGNVWWKHDKTNEQLRDEYAAAARSQVDYALGANPYGRSYLVGFGERPFNHPHHRGAYGAWAGFNHFRHDQPEFRPETCRHVLYGALIAGPDNQDVFTNKRIDADYVFRDRANPKRQIVVPKFQYAPSPDEVPIQLVMNSVLNEVALDYNAGFTASLALLTHLGHSSGDALADDRFPPADERDESADPLTTDREFFVVAARAKGPAGVTEVEVTVYNRSRWPARVMGNLSFRYYFTLDAGAAPESVKVEPLDSGKTATFGGVRRVGGDACYVEISFPNDPVFPGDRERKHDLRRARFRLSSPQWDAANDPSAAGLGEDPRLMPAIPVYDAGQRIGGDEPR